MEVWEFWYCPSYTSTHWRCYQLSSQCEYWQTKIQTFVLYTIHCNGYVLLTLYCVHITVYIVAWFNMLPYYRGCFLKPCLLGHLHLNPVWDSREPTGKCEVFVPGNLVLLVQHQLSVYRCIYRVTNIHIVGTKTQNTVVHPISKLY